VAAEVREEEDQRSTNNNRNQNIRLDPLIKTLKKSGFEVQQNKDFGAGQIDLVCKIAVHPSLPSINCGFIVLRSEEGGGSKDSEDNQFSLRKIEEAIVRGIRSGMDKVYLLAPNEEMAKSVTGKIEWLASFGSVLRLDAISLGMFPTQQQQKSTVITPSQKRVPQGKKIRKQTIREREAKINRYSKPKGEKSKKGSKRVKNIRERLLDKHSRPKSQRKRKESRR
jgi:hypothetical protein